jgi:hypothetical protein
MARDVPLSVGVLDQDEAPRLNMPYLGAVLGIAGRLVIGISISSKRDSPSGVA